MPKKPITYSNTTIYKIVCNDINIKACYVSYTTNFKSRQAEHKRRCNKPTDECYYSSLYSTIRKHGGWDNWSMLEVEKYTCNDRNEAKAKARIYFEQMNANLNLVQKDKDGNLIYDPNLYSEGGRKNAMTDI